MSRCLPLLALAFLGVAACAPLPVHTSLPVEVRPSPNFGERRPNYVVLHHTSNSDAARVVATLTRPASQVSAHYLVVRDGRIVYMVDERLRAWHAGEVWYWGGNRDINSASIGIEIDNDGREPYIEQQITALLALLADLKTRWSIRPRISSGMAMSRRDARSIPAPTFPGSGSRSAVSACGAIRLYEPAAPGVDDALLIAALGYDVTNLPAAIGAFRRRYFAVESTAPLTEAERGMAQCLRRKDEG